MRGWVAAGVAGIALVAGCGTVDGGSATRPLSTPSQGLVLGSDSSSDLTLTTTRGPAPDPTPDPTPDSDPTPISVPVRFSPCGHKPAPKGTTNLRVKEVTAKNSGLPPGRWTVRLEQVMRLRLPGGKVSAGNGFEAMTGGDTFVAVAGGTVTADVTMAVVEGGGDHRVAFVELRVGPGRPVSWVSGQKLYIGTDGGDGGFVSTAAQAQAPYSDDVDAQIDQYVDALYSSGAPSCILRRSGKSTEPNGFLFETGIGDGGYPTYVGLDASGRITSVVHYGQQLPWALSGLPGTPPSGLPEDDAPD
jgi:hypothetical protein